jgi:hypothetical protein
MYLLELYLFPIGSDFVLVFLSLRKRNTWFVRAGPDVLREVWLVFLKLGL